MRRRFNEAVLNAVHIKDGKAKPEFTDLFEALFSAQGLNKAVMVRGHPYDEENTYIDPKGNRRCRACRTENRIPPRAGGTAGPRLFPHGLGNALGKTVLPRRNPGDGQREVPPSDIS